MSKDRPRKYSEEDVADDGLDQEKIEELRKHGPNGKPGKKDSEDELEAFSRETSIEPWEVNASTVITVTGILEENEVYHSEITRGEDGSVDMELTPISGEGDSM
jgi:hypothetical protein